MMRRILLGIVMILGWTMPPVYAQTRLENTQACAVRDLHVTCQQGEKVKLDVIRTSQDRRGEVFLKIHSKDPIGGHITLYVNDNKPEILTITNGKGSYIPLNIILKLRSAKSLRFAISMKKGKPIMGNLNQQHFAWLQRFGKLCH